MDFAICFLAYGEEHINEFNIVAQSLLDLHQSLKIYVGTNTPELIKPCIYKTITLGDEFNYNLKREILEYALRDFNTVMLLDTDVFIKGGIDFSAVKDLPDKNILFYDELVDLEELKDVYGSLEYMKDYLDILELVHNDDLKLVHEGLFTVKLIDQEVKVKFLETWRRLDLVTRPYQKKAYDQPGAMEGILLYISLIRAGIQIEDATSILELKKLYSHIAHFGSRGRKLVKTLI